MFSSKQCNKCGRTGIFLKLDDNGICKLCAAEHTAHKESLEKQLSSLERQVSELQQILSDEQAVYNAIVQKAQSDAVAEISAKKEQSEKELSIKEVQLTALKKSIQEITTELESKEKGIKSAENKVKKSREIVKRAQYSLQKLETSDDASTVSELNSVVTEMESFLSPSVELKLQCMNVRQLRKEFSANQQEIKKLLIQYSSRYTTKANLSIYQLMVIALESELQNVLYNIGYGKIDKATSNVKEITEKYQKIAADGNQSIAPTIKKFISEIEYLFLRAVEIEYEYYVQRERTKEEQRAIRDQMRQEAAERKELARQQKLIEKEEQKYTSEIDAVNELIEAEIDQGKIAQLEERLRKLQGQLDTLDQKKEEIIRIQSGKAGNVYIISNAGAFGESVFKIGMTRRIDPTERVKELGDASVPFPFDIHSFIFSEDAVKLESELHKRLNDQRVNRVNLRKEFFNTSIDELEELVYELEPSAEFNKTMIAEQYNQSLSITDVPDDAYLQRGAGIDDEFDDESDDDDDTDLN
jgi:hypothetical protein